MILTARPYVTGSAVSGTYSGLSVTGMLVSYGIHDASILALI